MPRGELLVKEFSNWGLHFDTLYGILFVKEFPKYMREGSLGI